MRPLTAILIVAAAGAAIYVDAVEYESAGIAFLGQALFTLTNWMAFWR